MLLTITTTHRPATDLGYLLHKNPARRHSFEVFGGTAHVFYPEAGDERCTAALLLEVDPVALVRTRSHSVPAIDQYVNDRPYAATSLLSVALGKVFASALNGRSTEKPDLVDTALPLEARIPALPSDEGAGLIRRLFEPLGYRVTVESGPLDTAFPSWGESPYHTVALQAQTRLQDLLAHLNVLIPVLDDEKHYWVGDDEVAKLMRRGGEWLATHPERELIVRRYLKHQRGLTREALRRLTEEDNPDPDAREVSGDAVEAELERPVSLNERRTEAVLQALRDAGAARVAGVGCGEGRLIETLLRDAAFTAILGMDVSVRALERAARRLHVDTMAPRQRERVQLVHGSLTYRDRRLAGWDAMTAVEVVEHLDPYRLDAFARTVFHDARPGHVVVTTPNAEYNALFPSLPAGGFRHPDHRFEWTREQFRDWASQTAGRYDYRVSFRPVGDEDASLGPPTQMAVFAL